MSDDAKVFVAFFAAMGLAIVAMAAIAILAG
jgi:hypothetical protein